MIQAFATIGLEDQIAPSTMWIVGASRFAVKMAVAIWGMAASVIAEVKQRAIEKPCRNSR